MKYLKFLTLSLALYSFLIFIAYLLCSVGAETFNIKLWSWEVIGVFVIMGIISLGAPVLLLTWFD